ncbi:MAG: hypothetical protein ACKOWJ_01435 [Micrococcales bacterium]
MKNNSLAMVATISLALGLASMIGYIDPAVCEKSPSQGFITCTEAANQHIWAAIGFASFGVITLVLGTIRSRTRMKRKKENH